MKLLTKSIASLTLAAALLATTACTKYYAVSDPNSGKTYYTTDYKSKGDGAVTFDSMHTGEQVVLQSSAIKEVSKEQAMNAQAKKTPNQASDSK